MRVSTIALLLLALCAAVAQQKGKKPADVEILETKAVRELTKISVDGKVRVTGEKPLKGLVIVFDFRSAAEFARCKLSSACKARASVILVL